MNQEKWAVFISGNGGNLQALMEEKDVALVVSSSPHAYGILRAKRQGVPVEIAETEEKALAVLKKYKIKNVFLAGYMKIVSTKFIDYIQQKGVLLNIHPSLLPSYKGLRAFEEAYKKNEKLYGVSVHHVVAEVDSGTMVKQTSFTLPEGRDFGHSQLLLHIQEQRTLREALRRYQ